MLTYPEVSATIGVSIPTIKAMVRRRQFPAPVICGARERWSLAVIRTWAEGRWHPDAETALSAPVA